MRPVPRFWKLRLLAGGAAILVGLPNPAGAWSGVQHIQVNKAAGRNVPNDMSAFRAFSRPMALPGIYPDLWKESRHVRIPSPLF